MNPWPVAALLAAAIAGGAGATTLDDAVALALAHEPSIQRAQAETDAAHARVRQAQAARLPSLTASGEASTGHMDYGQFFGFGAQGISPTAARLTLQQPLFAGGALTSAVAQASAGQAASKAQLEKAKLDVRAEVAQAYGQVLVAEDAFRATRVQLDAATELVRQAGLKFDSGEAPRTDLAQAQARAAEARAGLAQAQADLAQARAHYHALTGEEPGQLAPFGPAPAIPPSLDRALAIARENNPGLGAARAGARGADAGERRARGGLWPEVSLVAEMSSLRDQFFPGYRADGYTIGVQGRWSLFSSGLQSAKIAEARAQRRAADASVSEATYAVDEGVITLWNEIEAADRMADAAAQELAATRMAEDSLGHEVKVNAKPTIDLLNAQRETLGARVALSKAKAAQVVTRYQLLSLLGTGDGLGASPKAADH